MDLGCGDGALAYELAKRTNLYICAVDTDAANVRRARERNSMPRACTAHALSHTSAHSMRFPTPSASPNLVVSGRSVLTGPGGVNAETVAKVQRPYGGVACFGTPDALVQSVRGPLDGAGTWTHQYCTPANNNCSADILAKGPLGMRWFRDSDFVMPSRHGRGPAPLFEGGRLFVEGLDALRATDAYNGRTLWEYPLPGILKQYDQEHLVGVSATGSNLCVDSDTVYVNVKDRCIKLDVATGEERGVIPTPPEPAGGAGTWGYIAIEDGTLYGSLADTAHVTWVGVREVRYERDVPRVEGLLRDGRRDGRGEVALHACPLD